MWHRHAASLLLRILYSLFFFYTFQIGTPEKAAAVHWRAQKTLKHTVLLALTDL